MIPVIDNLPFLSADVREAFEQQSTAIAAGWNREHDGDGGHGDVSVRTLSADADAVLSPQQITANTNNYEPPGIQRTTVLRVKTDASRNLTGLKTPDPLRRKWLLVVNVGAQDLVLVDESTSSSVGNRFACPGSANLTLNGDDSVWIWYDVASMRWRPIGV